MTDYGTTDRCTGGTASASTVYSTYVAANAFDNNDGTVWMANAVVTQWLKYDFGAGVSWRIAKITIKNNYDPRAFALQGSNNDSDWTEIGTGELPNDTGTYSFEFTNATAYRYVRINITTSWSGYPTICEVQMYEQLIQEETGTAAISGNGSQTVNGKKAAKITTSISGNGLLTLINKKGALGTPIVSGNGLLTLVNKKGAFGMLLISGNGSLVATGYHSYIAIISGGGDILAIGTKQVSDSVILSGNGSLLTTATKQVSDSASISGNGSLLVSSKKAASGTCLVSGDGSVIVIGLSSTPGVIIISGGGSITVTGEVAVQALFVDWETAVNASVRQWQLYTEIYFDGDSNPPTIFNTSSIVGWDLLEEAYAEGDTPLGSVSSNEFVLTLDNSNGYFTPTNITSPYYGKLLPNLLVKARLLIKIGENYQYINLGEYRTGDWSAPSDLLEAEVICHDDIYELGQRDIPQIPALQSVNLQFMWSVLLQALNLNASDYIIDEFTQGISIGWFINAKVLDNLQLLAQRGAGGVFGDRDSKVRIKNYYYPPLPIYNWNDNNQLITADLPQSYENVYSRVKVSYYMPYVSNTTITLLTTSLTVPIGGGTFERLQISSGPVGIFEGINIIGSENVTIESISMGMWDITIELGNSGTDEEEITLEVRGKKIEYNVSSVTVEDTALYNKIGNVTLEIDNHLIQSKTEATSLANYILQLVTDPISYITINARGDPYIKLVDTMNIDYPNGNIDNLDIIPIRLHHTFREGLSAEVEGIKKSVRELGG